MSREAGTLRATPSGLSPGPGPGGGTGRAMDDCPEFAEAKRRFARFLESQGCPGEICWIFRDDFYWYRQDRAIVRWPTPETNETLTRQHFDVGRQLGRGVELAALFSSYSLVFAHVWFPGDDLDAEYAMITGLKLSIRQPLPEAVLKASGWRWTARQLLPAYRHHHRVEEHVSARRMAVP